VTQPIRIAIVSGVALGALAVLTLVYLFDPSSAGFFPPCIFRMITGFECPGCGSTRGLHALLHGDVVTAWNFNPLMFVVVPLIALFAAWEGLRFAGVKMRPLNPPTWSIWMLVVVAVVFAIVRNMA
jgi:hypothetical protein